MVKRVQRNRHSTTALADAYVGLEGEITVDLEADELRLHDGATAGGVKVARADLVNALAATVSTPGTMSAADKSKLDGIETGATDDLTGAEIKVLYEAESDTNAYDDAAVAKLAGIEASADVTDATNVNAAGAVMESDYDAQSILIAVADNTPTVLTVAASRLLGRKASGDLGVMTVAEAKTLLAIAAGDVSGLGSFALLSNVPDNEITLARLAHLTQGSILYYAATGTPTELAAGTAGQFLKTQGAAADPIWDTVIAGLVPIERKASLTDAASLDFITGIDGTYRSYIIKGWAQPATDNVELILRTDGDGGASFDAGASDYTWSTINKTAGVALAESNDATDPQIPIIRSNSGISVGNAADERCMFTITFEDPSNAAFKPQIQSTGMFISRDAAVGYCMTFGVRNTAGAINAIQLLFSSGDISAYDVTLYGVTNA